MKMDTIPTVLLNRFARLPEYATPDSAYADIRAVEAVTIFPGDIKLLRTGLAMAIPRDYFLDIRPRSGLSKERPNYIINSPGTGDPDYRGEYKIAVINNAKTPWHIMINDRIAQVSLAPRVRGFWVPVDQLPPTERGEGGFGSTGLN